MAAAMVTANPATSAENVISNTTVAQEDDEKFLYGENSEKKPSQENGLNENGEKVNGDAENDNDDDDDEYEDSDDDDDDDIQVHIGEVNTNGPNQFGTTGSWKKEAPTTTAATANKAAASAGQGQKKLDVNAVGSINGQPIYEFDIDTNEEEKAWRKPGADISDYFNYGFTEETWKQYCDKQRRMRLESSRTPYTVTAAAPVAVPTAPNPVEFEVMPDGRTRIKAGPPPDRKVEGSIHVLGSDDARRKQKEDELLALALGQPRIMPQAPFAAGPRSMYTALPGGVVYNGPPNEMSGHNPDIQSSQPQQIQSIGAPSSMTTVMPPGFQYLPAGPGGMAPMGPPGAPLFPPSGMDLGLPPPFGHRGNSDSEYDSEGERRHRRRDSGRSHRRHRDRSDRDRDRDRSNRDRDRERSSRSDRDRSVSRRRHESRSTSDRKKHSRSRDDDESRSSSRRRTKVEIKQEPMDDSNTDAAMETPVADQAASNE